MKPGRQDLWDIREPMTLRYSVRHIHLVQEATCTDYSVEKLTLKKRINVRQVFKALGQYYRSLLSAYGPADA